MSVPLEQTQKHVHFFNKVWYLDVYGKALAWCIFSWIESWPMDMWRVDNRTWAQLNHVKYFSKRGAVYWEEQLAHIFLHAYTNAMWLRANTEMAPVSVMKSISGLQVPQDSTCGCSIMDFKKQRVTLFPSRQVSYTLSLLSAAVHD